MRQSRTLMHRPPTVSRRGAAQAARVLALLVGIVAALFLLAGCQSKTRPAPADPTRATSQPLTLEQMVERLQQRAEGIEQFSASGTVTLTRVDGDGVTLDAAVAAALPDRLRLRTYKMGSAAFDLTLRPDGLWVWKSPRAADVPIDLPGQSVRPIDLAPLLVGGLPVGRYQIVRLDDRHFAALFNFDGPAMMATIDREFGQVRRYRFTDPVGSTHDIELGDYQPIDGRPWPHRVTIRSGEGEINLRFDDVQLNSDLPAGAFTPPADAVRRD